MFRLYSCILPLIVMSVKISRIISSSHRLLGKILMCGVMIPLPSLYAQSVSSNEKSSLSLAIVDSAGPEHFQTDFSEFERLLSEKTQTEITISKISIDPSDPSSLKAPKFDLVFCSPAEYVLLKKRTDFIPAVGLFRPDHFSVVVVLAGIGLYTPQDLKNRRVAIGNTGSPLFHLAPLQIFKDSGIDPRHDIKTAYSTSQAAWEALKIGDIDALALSNERYQIFKDRERQLKTSDFRVIARGADMPSDVLMASPKLDPKLLEKIRKAFLENSSRLVELMVGEENKERYQGLRYVPKVLDREYNSLRRMFKTAGFPEFSDSSSAG